MRSVCARSFSMSIFAMSQLATISSPASRGMMPSRPCTFASVFSTSKFFAVLFSSDQTKRMSSVLKMLPKMDESMMLARMGFSCGRFDGGLSTDHCDLGRKYGDARAAREMLFPTALMTNAHGSHCSAFVAREPVVGEIQGYGA